MSLTLEIFSENEKSITIRTVFLFLSIDAQKFNDLINLKKYEEANKEYMKTESDNKKRPVVFIGNSITEGWVRNHPDFFANNNFIGRGISGQTSPQLLSRFRSDVVDLKPSAVIINVGTNDIAENSGKYDLHFTLGNIKSMAEIAKANKIRVILTSVLPAKGFGWNQSITDAPQKIEELNKEIKAYAKENGFLYIDYHTQLKDENGALKSNFGNDGVHPNAECYELMEKIGLSALKIKTK